MNTPKIKVILGSTREGRAGENVAKWVMKSLEAETSAQLSLLDLKDYPLPFFADAIPPLMRQGKHPLPEVQKWIDQIDDADGFIIITPEYNHSFTAVLKNALDYPCREWHDKSVGFVSYGAASGGIRAVEQLRQVVGELHMYDVRDQVSIPMIWAAFDEAGNLQHAEMHEKNLQLVFHKVVELANKLSSNS
jgi:NAD(P)H-dependent FMN reductase